MEERRVVTCFLQHEGRVLVLRRSARVGTYRGRWAGVSGTIEAPTPLEQAYTELAEEVGLGPEDVTLLRQAPPLAVDDPALGVRWWVHPFLFAVRDPTRIVLDWEHVEARWVDPAELGSLETVPRLKETWQLLWTTSRGA